MSVTTEGKFLIEVDGLQALFDVLKAEGYDLVGPTVQQEAIVYGPLNSVEDLPAGWTDEQEAGSYRLKRRDDDALFGYAVGPHSWKKFLFPPSMRLWQALRNGDNSFQVVPEEQDDTKYAFIGVRSCELHAIAIQNKVFKDGAHADSHYKTTHDRLFTIAVNCGTAGGTCFCVSMNTGPKATSGYDISMTEVLEEGRHYFVVETGTEQGQRILEKVTPEKASESNTATAEAVVDQTAQQMGRVMDTTDIKELLYRNYENPRWDDVADRCLSCTNCTMVCPTCFCSSVEDTSDVTGQSAERWRRWDSCFTMDFSYIHGGSVRPSSKSRYRQWMTHKLASWIDQFGTSGCVGCGRCITWCPVGIDITEEIRAIRDSESETQA